MNWLPDRVVNRLRNVDAGDERATEDARTAAGACEQAFEVPGGRYRFLTFVARGGMGAVWLAEDTALGRRVAIKLLAGGGPSAELQERLLREARILARLEHPGIIPIHDVGTLADGRAFYAMKYVEGHRLDAYFRDVTSLPDRMRLYLKICDAVAFANARGIVHRDLKPENIMVGPFGEVLILDWGVAKLLEEPRDAGMESPGTVIGTPGFMAPEQARGDVDGLDPRADVYALGAILREAAPRGELSGGQSIPRALAAVIEKAMAVEPADRYADAGDLGRDVTRFLDGQPPLAYPDNWIRRSGRLVRRHQGWLILIAAYLAMRAALAFWPRP